MRLFTLAAAAVVACGSGPARSPDDDDERKRRDLHFMVEHVACLAPLEHDECDSSLRASFQGRISGEIWCQDGQPYGRFNDGKATIGPAPFPQMVWEAIWRVLAATDDCALASEKSVRVSRGGITRPCDDPSVDMTDVLERAYRMARGGPPSESRITEIRFPGCPPFEADAWNGVTRPRPELPSAPTDSEIRLMEIAAQHNEIRQVIEPLLPAARQCVKSDLVLVVLVFSPDGSLARVNVRDATGTPLEACVRSALERARIQPFSGKASRISITLRPAQ